MKRIWILIAAAALLSGCATYRQADGYYVENRPAGGAVVYGAPGSPWVDPYYNPFFGSYLPAVGYGHAPYVYGSNDIDGPVVVFRRHDRHHRSPRDRRWATADPDNGDRTGRDASRPDTRVWEHRSRRDRALERRTPSWRGAQVRHPWNGPLPAAKRSGQARRPAAAPRREPTRRRHERPH